MSFTDKQIYDLNNMNVAAQNVELGQYLQDLSNIDNIQHGGKLNPFKDISSYKENYDAYKGKDMYIAIDGGEYTDSALDIPNTSQNDENPPKLHLTVTNANLTTGHYPMYIESNATDMRIAMPYLVDKGVDAPVFTAKAGENYYKSPDGEI